MSKWTTPLSLFRQYMIAAGRSPKTVRLRLYYLERLAAVEPDPWEVTPTALLEWLAGPHWSPETRKSARASVSIFYRWAVAYELTTADPSRLLPPVRVPRALPRPAPGSVVARALSSASPRDRIMIMLAAYAGLRRAEIARLEWSAVTDHTLHVVGKGGRHRVVPLAPELEAELHAARRARITGSAGRGWRYEPDKFSRYVFPGLRPGTHMSVETVGRVLAEALGQGYTAHTLRHRFGTAAYAGTHDLRAVQELLGHASSRTTEIYTAVAVDSLRAAVEAAIGHLPADSEPVSLTPAASQGTNRDRNASTEGSAINRVIPADTARIDTPAIATSLTPTAANKRGVIRARLITT
jgi:integrase